VFLITCVGCGNSKTPFDKSQWIDAKDSGKWSIRKRMAGDLIENKTLIGKKKSEIVQLLGEPERFSNIPNNQLYYTIELDYGMDIDPVKIEYLIVTLNSESQAIEVIRKVILDK
jgi:hypothetical protein